MLDLKDEFLKAGFSELAKFHVGAALRVIYGGIGGAIRRTLSDAAVINYESHSNLHPIVQALKALSNEASRAAETSLDEAAQIWQAVSTLALLAYNQASELGLSPLNAYEILNIRGWARVQQGFLPEAEECFLTVLGDVHPDGYPRHLLDRKAFCNLAIVKYFNGHVERAYDLLDRADYHEFGFKSAHMNRLSFASRSRDEAAIRRGARLLRKVIPTYGKDSEMREYLSTQSDLSWMRSEFDMKELFPELFAKSKRLRLPLEYVAVIAGSIGIAEIAGSIVW